MTDPNQQAPLATSRRAHVLDALARDGVVRVSQLIEELGAAPVTLRRDLAQMEREGLLVRVHGGAVPAGGADAGRPAGGARRAAASAAPAIAEGSNGSIAVLVPSLNYYWPGVIRGMDAEARKLGLSLILREASYKPQDERPTLERLIRTEGVRGVIAAPNTGTPHAQDVVQWLHGCGLPSVLIERDAMVLPQHEPVESVTTDHALGAVLAARHLADLGHTNVGLVLSRFSPTSRKIATGWHEACEELGLVANTEFEPLLPHRTNPDFAEAVVAALDTAIAQGMTGLLVHSDPEAMAFIDVALSRGISVPGDLSVIAYDDEVAQLFTPALTAVSPPRTSVGASAVSLLAQRLEDPSRPVHRIVLSPSLNVRASTSAPGAPAA